MYIESFEKYIDELRKWDGTSPRPRSVYERALFQSRELLLDGDSNYVLVPGMNTLLRVLRVGERFSVVEMKSIFLEPLRAFLKECSPGIKHPWIELCFFEDDTGIHYDSFYDSLPIGEGNDITIKEYIDKLEQSSAGLLSTIPVDSVLTISDKEAFQKPFRYLFQQRGIKALFYDSSSSVHDTVIEPSVINLELMTPCGSFVPCVGKTYRMTSYEGQSLPSFAAPPELLYSLTYSGEYLRLLSYLVKFESDCFGNITVFSSVTPNTLKVTPLF